MGRRLATLTLVILLAGAFCQTARAEESGQWEAEHRGSLWGELSQSFNEIFRSKPRAYWDRGFVLETKEKAFALHVGYEVQADAVWYDGMNAKVETAAGGQWLPGLEIRRNRVSLEVFFLRNWFVRARYGVAGFSDLQFQDLFLEWSGLNAIGEFWPVIRVGQIKEPMTLDWMNNGLRTTFAERAMFTTTIVPNRNLGVRVHGTGYRTRVAYQAGLFFLNEAEMNEHHEGDGQAVTLRITGLPWVRGADARSLLHVGLSGSWRWDDDDYSLKSKAETWVGPEVVGTGEFRSHGASIIAGEVLYQRNRLALTAEAAWTRVRLAGGGSADFFGGYGQISYFLTPMHRPYNRRFGCYGRVRPERSVFTPESSGPGAWEVAARVSALDLDAGPLPGGAVWNITLGLNWYARDNLRVTLNYVRTNVDDAFGVEGADDTMNAFVWRIQYDL